MALTIGSRLGPYEVVAVLGAGGMGEVYRARDTKLNRDVALKVLPDAFATDPDRLARFTREAQTLAALNDPHIAHLHGLEESNAVRALVMELVDGEDLAERIARGPIPLDEALPIARQIAEALEAAHGQGIIHRDLKPANVKVRGDGTVKVLDFGLAKAMDPLTSSTASLAASPTVTSPAAMTAAGIILGTAAYMSPEQARGKVVDKRADIWAFGCVLYEMLTATRPFGGDDVTETIAAVVRADPDWTKLPGDTPTAIRRLLRRCLEKDRIRRLPDAADARLEIDDALIPVANAEAAAQPAGRAGVAGWARMLPWAIAGALAGALMLALWAPWRSAASPRVTRTTITTSGLGALSLSGFERDVAISPDGRHVIYVGNGGTQLFVRALDAFEPVAIATSSAGVRSPIVSPDGQWVGVIVGGNTLQRVAITGGTPVTLAGLDGPLRGITWGADDTIVFATNNRETGLQRVPAASANAGGPVEVVTRPDHAQGEADHFHPEVLPGGRAVLFTIVPQKAGVDPIQVAVRDLRTGAQKTVLRGGSDAHYVSSGHLVYVAAGALRAIAFDPNRLETYGASVPVVSRLATTFALSGNFAVAPDGTLVYVDVPGDFVADARTLVWVDRAGKEEPVAAPPRAYGHPRLSPDGTRVALWINDQEDDVWILDLPRAPVTRLTVDPGMDRFPVWTPDGKRVIFTSNRGGRFDIWSQAPDGVGTAERLTTSNSPQFPSGIAPNGAVVFSEATAATRSDVLQLAPDGSGKVTPLVQTKSDERNGIVSPDGHWLAYESDHSGPYEVYAQAFANAADGPKQVSTAGGTRPLWSRSGKELFYLGADGALQRVPVEANGTKWQNGPPTKMPGARYYHTGTFGRTYDVSLDGQRFLMIKAPGTGASATPPTIVVVQHWDEELKRRVPTR